MASNTVKDVGELHINEVTASETRSVIEHVDQGSKKIAKSSFLIRQVERIERANANLLKTTGRPIGPYTKWLLVRSTFDIEIFGSTSSYTLVAFNEPSSIDTPSDVDAKEYIKSKINSLGFFGDEEKRACFFASQVNGAVSSEFLSGLAYSSLNIEVHYIDDGLSMASRTAKSKGGSPATYFPSVICLHRDSDELDSAELPSYDILIHQPGDVANTAIPLLGPDSGFTSFPLVNVSSTLDIGDVMLDLSVINKAMKANKYRAPKNTNSKEYSRVPQIIFFWQQIKTRKSSVTIINAVKSKNSATDEDRLNTLLYVLPSITGREDSAYSSSRSFHAPVSDPRTVKEFIKSYNAVVPLDGENSNNAAVSETSQSVAIMKDKYPDARANGQSGNIKSSAGTSAILLLSALGLGSYLLLGQNGSSEDVSVMEDAIPETAACEVAPYESPSSIRPQLALNISRYEVAFQKPIGYVNKPI